MEPAASANAPMSMIKRIRITVHIVWTLALTSFVSSLAAQEAVIPDPGLNAAIKEELNIIFGQINEQDLLSLTSLFAGDRNIRQTDGLEGAVNLTFLDLDSNLLTNFALPSGFTSLTTLDVSFNALTQCTIPEGQTNLESVVLEGNALTNFTAPG